MTDLEAFKAAAAAAALALVQPGMRLGLGTGSTARHFVGQLGARFSTGALPGILCVPTSEATRAQAEALGLPLATLDALDRLDLTVDGADEFDPALALIKGGGGALLREKIVAAAADRMVVIADVGKKVTRLGAYPLPVEILPFGRKVTERAVARVLAGEGISGECRLRLKDGAPLLTDNGNVILDCHCGAIADPARLAAALEAVPGVMAQGLFIGLCTGAFVAGPEGVEQIGRTS